MTGQATAALLAILLGLLVCPSSAFAARTAAGVQVDQKCSQATRDSIDKMNRAPSRAKIRSATCRPDGTLEKVGLRALEGGDMQWTSEEGMDALSRRMKQGP